MGRITIEAFEDRTRADGGHAVILLMGLKAVPSPPAFRLRPAGLEPDVELPFAWPEGDLLPTTARVTSRGVELVVGPDIAENPLMIAGCAVEISLPDAGMHGEFLWPAIQPMARPKRRSIVGRASQRDERLDPVRPAERLARSLASTAPPQSDPRPDAVVRTEGKARAEIHQQPASRSEPINTRKDLTAMSDSLHDAQSENAPSPVQANQQKRESTEFVTFYPHARGGRLKTDKNSRPGVSADLTAVMPVTPGGMAAAIVAGVVIVQGLLYMLQGGPSVIPATIPTASVATIESVATATQADQLFEAFVSSPTSPRGVNARDVPGTRALETAQTLLLALDGARDTEEGAFWLKRYLQGAIGDERTLRALTHLGSSYAEPTSRSPDYAKARLVWEMAGALGDPVAMCLLGVVHENGLGVARDKKKALPWYERAKKAGGCPDVDESIARARQ